jgi:hypothetical protein
MTPQGERRGKSVIGTSGSVFIEFQPRRNGEA